MLVQDFLEHNAHARADKTALVSAGRRFSYAQLDAMANRLANALRQQGVQRGDRVAIFLGNSVEAVCGIFAVLKADAAFVVLNRTIRPDKLVAILKNCQATAILVDGRAM